jgi:hypothetical protein
MQLKPRTTRTVALLTGGVIAATTLFHPAPAQAADKSKKLKYGAVGLGVLGAYLLSKGKTVPGAVAAAGGLYAYKKGRNEQRDERFSNRNRDGRDYGYNNGGYRGGGYSNGSYDNGYYDDNGYGYDNGYRANAQYRDNRGRNERDRNRDADCRDDRGGRGSRNDRRDDRGRRNNRNDRPGNYDLSPYLR